MLSLNNHSSVINISQMNLNSDRMLDEDPLQSVREGSDFNEDSDSEMGRESPVIKVVGCDDSNKTSDSLQFNALL